MAQFITEMLKSVNASMAETGLDEKVGLEFEVEVKADMADGEPWTVKVPVRITETGIDQRAFRKAAAGAILAEADRRGIKPSR
jgi:hypothetical protein